LQSREETRLIGGGGNAVTTAADRGLADRRWSTWGLATVVSTVAFLVLAFQAWNDHVFTWDSRLSRAIHGLENRSGFWNRHIDPFELALALKVQVIGLALVGVVVVLLVARGRRRDALFVAVTLTGAAITGALLKPVIALPPVDPDGSGYSFPSGHAVRSMAVVGPLVVIAWTSRWRWAAIVVGAAVVGLVGFAVVYHEWHWVSDVLAGWFLSIAWISAVALVLFAQRETGGQPADHGRARAAGTPWVARR
jgi:membrane-associated phospholipid phosphatase